MRSNFNSAGVSLRIYLKIPDFSLFQTNLGYYVQLMKYLVVIATVLALNSCNTSIGIYRDTKQAVSWTKAKVQGGGSESY